MNSTIDGVFLLVAAGAMNGSFTLPMKFTREWAWENTWLVWTIWALVIFPPLMTLTTVPHLHSIYGSVTSSVILTVALCGAGWGLSQVFFGLAVDSVGIALAFSVILGIAAAVGALVPLFQSNEGTQRELIVVAGVVLVIIGVGICAIAGRRREAAQGRTLDPTKASLGRGLIYCTISGVGSALVGIGLWLGTPIGTAAEHAGVSAVWSPNAIWLPLMVAGGIPNLIYCLYLIGKNHTGNRFGKPQSFGYVILAGIMGVFWFGSTLMYGIAVRPLGTAVAWPIFMSLIVIVASVWGLLTGEWKNSGKRPLQIMYGGIAVLILAIIVLSRAS